MMIILTITCCLVAGNSFYQHRDEDDELFLWIVSKRRLLSLYTSVFQLRRDNGIFWWSHRERDLVHIYSIIWNKHFDILASKLFLGALSLLFFYKDDDNIVDDWIISWSLWARTTTYAALGVPLPPLMGFLRSPHEDNFSRISQKQDLMGF